MEKKKTRLLHVHAFLFDKYTALKQLLLFNPTLDNLYEFTIIELQRITRLSSKEVEKFYKFLHSTNSSELLQSYNQLSIQITTIFDPDYPILLKNIFDPPFVIYLLGKKELLQTNKLISLIGSRKPTMFANIIGNELIPPLVNEGWITISGLAKGIDTLVHEKTIQSNGHTIAVIGNGFQYIYPKENDKLSKLIASKHLLLTEYPPFIPPQKWYFPKRNRIIAGLSRGTVVIEAKEKSGTMITADLALEYGRDVFAVPGPFIMDEYIGCHRLIQSGAKLVVSANDIIQELEYCYQFIKKNN
jgi:DNA processing protein